MLLEQCYAVGDLLIGDLTCMAQDNTACIFYLVIKELAEILHVHLALVCVNNGCESVECRPFGICVLYSLDNVG